MSGVTSPAQDTVKSLRDADVAVIEHRGRVEKDFKNQNRNSRRSQRRDRAKLDRHREQNFDRMKAQAGGHVELEIGMMHPMQPPEGRDRVKEDVLQVDGEIE